MDNQILNIVHVVRARQLQAANLLCLLVAFITQRRQSAKKHANIRTRNENLRRRCAREETLHDLSKSGKCHELIRTSEKAYITEGDGLLAEKKVTLENQYNNDDDIQVVYSTPSLSQKSLKAKKYKSKKRKLEQEDEVFNSKLMDIIDNVANAIREGNKILERVCHREYLGEEIYKELESMGLEPHGIPRFSGLIYLAGNQAKTRTLFSRPPQLRMSVLKAMMGAGN